MKAIASAGDVMRRGPAADETKKGPNIASTASGVYEW